MHLLPIQPDKVLTPQGGKAWEHTVLYFSLVSQPPATGSKQLTMGLIQFFQLFTNDLYTFFKATGSVS